LLILGCGDVGLRIAAQLAGRFKLYGTSRAPNVANFRALQLHPVTLDLDQPPRQTRRSLNLAKWAIYLAPPPNAGDGDQRLAQFLARWRGTRLTYISTTGVYGDCGGAQFDETRAVAPASDRAKRRVAAESLIRSGGRHGIRSSILRAPGIYAAERLPLDRLRAGTPALIAADDVFTNHIHADDLARLALTALMRAGSNRLFHAVDDSDLRMGDYFDLVADAFGLPRPPRLGASAVQAVVSPALWSFMRESRRLLNQRIKTDLRFALRYPSVQDGIAAARAMPGLLQS
jgi:nucleoside-diphosphate-sugar epimerase